MFYSRLAEFIASQTKGASVACLADAKPKVSRGLVAKTDLALICDEAFERILDAPNMYPGRLKMAVGERTKPAWNFSDRKALEKEVAKHAATLLVLGVQLVSPWWKSLCDDIETRLGMGVMAVGIKTPARKSGLLVHWDMGDVGAVQAFGEKKWYLWPPVVELKDVCALRDLTPAEKRRKPEMEVVLTPGDVLHVPRGWVHRAETRGSAPSQHVSVGIIHPDMRKLGLGALM